MLDILQDGFFAALAAVGFGSISNAPKRVLIHCGWIAAVGHATRYVLTSNGLNIIIAAFAGAVMIGIFGRIVSQKKDLQFETLAFVSLLPMIPGMYAYRTMQNFIRCIEGAGNEAHDHFFSLMSYNALMTFAIIMMMAIGVLMVPKKIVRR